MQTGRSKDPERNYPKPFFAHSRSGLHFPAHPDNEEPWRNTLAGSQIEITIGPTSENAMLSTLFSCTENKNGMCHILVEFEQPGLFMLNRFQTLVSVFSLFLVAACGGSSSSLEEMEVSVETLAEATLGLPFRSGETLPSRGSASFEGALAFTLVNGQGYEGLLAITTNLANDTVSGEASNFQNLEGREVDGTVQLRNGAIRRDLEVSNFYILGADLSGVLTDGGQLIALDTRILGNFLEGETQYLSGELLGDVFVDGDEVELLDSVFVVECEGTIEACRDALVLKPQTQDPDLLFAYVIEEIELVDMSFDFPITDSAALPLEGSAQYEGVALIDTVKPGFSVLGNLELNFDLNEGRVNGVATKFVGDNADVLEGALTITDGTIDRTGDTMLFAVEFSGTLNDANSTYDFDGSAPGRFLGSNGETVSARPEGTVTVDGVSYGIAGGSLLAGSK